MDLKQALQQGGGGISNASNNSKGSCATNSLGSQGEVGNHCSSSNTSTNTGDTTSSRGSPAAPLLCGGPSSHTHHNHYNNNNNNITSRISTNSLSRPLLCDLDTHDPRLLKLARLHDPPSPVETQALINLNGNFHQHTSNNNSSSSTHNHSTLSSYLSISNHSSNHASPTSNYPPSTCSLLNGGSSLPSKLYPFASLEDPRHHSPFLLSAASQAALLPSARAHHASLPCFSPEPVVSLFTPEQLLEFTQQTYVFKHFAAGVAPPAALLLPIINSVVSLGRMGAASMNFGSNAGMFGVGGLRGNVDPEPGRCRRTDGKKWRCAREVVADQKYCERHMHRGRHRARANKLANAGVEGLNASPNLPPNSAPNPVSTHTSSGISLNTPATFASLPKEPHLQFSLQPASAASTPLNKSNSVNEKLIADPSGGMKRLLEGGHNMGGAFSSTARSLAAPPEDPPNLAEMLKMNASAKPSFTNHLPKSQMDSAFPYACQTSDRDADNLALREFVGGDHWPRITRVADNPPANSSLSWFDQLAEEQNKRNRFNTELSIATHKSSLNLSAKFGGDQHEDIVDPSHYMGLSMAVGAKVGGAVKEEERYSSRSSWVPIAWENPTIGGPLGEVLQSNGATSGGNYSGSLANNGGEGCLNLIEEVSWEHNVGGHASSPAKDSHSPSLASPTGVLQMKTSFASYSDSSSSASSPRSALKLDSANLGN